MKVILHKRFEKQYAKLRLAEKERFKTRRNVFLRNPFDPILNNHGLSGKYQGCNSINITGDLRAVYMMFDSQTAFFIAIGSHSQLYK